MARRATPRRHFDLWLDEADLTRLDAMANHWQISRQRVIESAVTAAAAGPLRVGDSGSYQRHRRVIVNLDGLLEEQLGRQAVVAGGTSEALRAALRAFQTTLEEHERQSHD
ncbi:MAG: hypothetical protein KF832_29980 [Caldilineaceae bacterium]|nr:hypothetical protein [Caldilineaceae bacterium]